MMKLPNHIANLPPYAPIEPFEVLSARLNRPPQSITKLDANENPYGPSPKAMAALATMPFPHIYPDPESRALRSALSHFTGVPESYLLAGAGADELIDLILRVLLEPGDCVISCPPTFGMYPFDTLLNAGQLIEVQRLASFALDIPGIRKAIDEHHPKVLFITTPNNPDGNFPNPAEIDTLLELPLVLVIDEAYIEFTMDGGMLGEKLSRITSVPARQNLVVLRTFSKWAGLAGLRVGYGVFPEWLLPYLWKSKQPYNVNVAASTAAIASIQDADYLAGNVALLRAERQRLMELLSTIPYLQPYPSHANFILCKVTDRPALDLKKSLEAQGILVRYYNTPLLRDYIRISVGRPEDTQVIITALQTLASPGSSL